MTPDEEHLLAKATKCFADANLPLTLVELKHLVQHYATLLPTPRREEVLYVHTLPSKQWIRGFLIRHPELYVGSVRAIEIKRIGAVTKDHICEHIARLQAAMQRYNITNPKHIFNLDESGVSFRKMTGRSLRKGIGYSNKHIVRTVVRTKGNLDRVIVMPVVNAAGDAFTPVVVYPGKQAHFMRVNGRVETLHNYLPNCYVYQRDVVSVDTPIFSDWAKGFLNETASMRKNGNKLLLVLDGYSCHIKFDVLKMLKENGVILIGLPAHTSHVLQPLDVSVFGAFKSFLEREALQHTAEVASEMSTLDRLLQSFCAQGRSLLSGGTVEKEGYVAVSTKSGAHLTSDAVIEALRQRTERIKKKKVQIKHPKVTRAERIKKKKVQIKHPKVTRAERIELEHLTKLAPEREIRRKKLKESRDLRRTCARESAIRKLQLSG